MTMLLVLLCQSTALLSLALLALRLTQKRGPAVQTLVGRATLCGVALLVLLLPLSGRIAPVWRIPVSPPAPILGSRKDVGTPLADLPAQPPASALPTSPELPPPVPVSTAAFASDTAEPAHQEGAGTTKGASRSAPTPPAAVPKPSFRKDPATEERAGVGFLAVSLTLLLWLGVCQFHLMRLRRSACIITDGPAAVLLAELTPHPPTLLTHPSVHSPFLAGIRRPAIFLPPAFAADFTPDALRAVFLHELAHRDRRDTLWTLAARLLTAILWFQPLLWLLARKLEQSSEDACDQAVLAAHCSPRAYAACLLSLAQRPPLACSQRTLTAGVAPFRSSVGRRISRILTQGVLSMPAVTLRLRLSIAALTVAAATGGAFLVSSAPAQTQPKPSSVVGTWQLRTTVEDSSTTGKVPYQNTYTFNPDKTGLYRIDIGRYWGHPEFHVACPFTWSEADGSITIKLPSSGADRVNEQQTGMVAPDRQTLLITTRRWQLKHWNGSSWQLSHMQTSFGVTRNIRRVTRSIFSLQGGPLTVSDMSAHEVKPDAYQLYAARNVQVHSILNNGNTVLQTSTAPDQQLGQAQFLAGLTPVQGPGVVVTLRDSKKPFPYSAGMPAGMPPPNIIHDTDINLVVNELKAAGAEAIAVNNQRLVATSAVRCTGPTVYVNSVPLAAPFVIKAIGDPKALAGALNIPGGEADQLKQYDKAMFLVQQAATLTLPAYSGGDTPRYAKPVAETAEAINAPIRQKLQYLHTVEKISEQRRLAWDKKHGLEGFLQFRDKTQAELVADKKLLDQYEQGFQAELHEALPRADAATLTKASNLESGLGGLVASMQFIQQLVEHYAGKHYSSASEAKKYAQANQGHLETIAARQAQIKPLLAEEAHLFPMTAQSQQHLAQVHTLAIKAHMTEINVMVDTMQLHVLDQRIRQH